MLFFVFFRELCISPLTVHLLGPSNFAKAPLGALWNLPKLFETSRVTLRQTPPFMWNSETLTGMAFFSQSLFRRAASPHGVCFFVRGDPPKLRFPFWFPFETNQKGAPSKEDRLTRAGQLVRYGLEPPSRPSAQELLSNNWRSWPRLGASDASGPLMLVVGSRDPN